jgi:Na+/H+ antiporter NhaA
MALFISGLALDGQALDAAKVGVLGASAVAAALGVSLLLATLPPPDATAGDRAHASSAPQ